jgi:hypothetical protein
VKDLVLSYLASSNRLPYADITFDINGEAVHGRLSGSDVFWSFKSDSPAFIKSFPFGELTKYSLLSVPASADIQSIFMAVDGKLELLSWKHIETDIR